MRTYRRPLILATVVALLIVPGSALGQVRGAARPDGADYWTGTWTFTENEPGIEAGRNDWGVHLPSGMTCPCADAFRLFVPTHPLATGPDHVAIVTLAAVGGDPIEAIDDWEREVQPVLDSVTIPVAP